MPSNRPVTRQASVVVKSATADVVREMIDSCHTKNQEQIAIETGFTRSNVLTMIKQGRTRMPMDKIDAFAKACGRPPEKLLRTALREYQPELAHCIGQVFNTPMFDGFEELIETFNAAITEAISDAKDSHRSVANDEQEMKQVLRLNGELDTSAEKLRSLKVWIKKNMVTIVAGGQTVPKIATETNKIK